MINVYDINRQMLKILYESCYNLSSRSMKNNEFIYFKFANNFY